MSALLTLLERDGDPHLKINDLVFAAGLLKFCGPRGFELIEFYLGGDDDES